jgi:hypothetical protein
VAKARSALLSLLGDLPPPAATPHPAAAASVHVPAARVGRLLGPRGTAIQLIREHTGATVAVDKIVGGDALVAITGGAAAVSIAEKVISRIAEATLL